MGKSSKAVIQSAFHSSGKLLFSQKTEFLKHRGMIDRKKRTWVEFSPDYPLPNHPRKSIEQSALPLGIR
jgi:hypothetical protein